MRYAHRAFTIISYSLFIPRAPTCACTPCASYYYCATLSCTLVISLYHSVIIPIRSQTKGLSAVYMVYPTPVTVHNRKEVCFRNEIKWHTKMASQQILLKSAVGQIYNILKIQRPERTLYYDIVVSQKVCAKWTRSENTLQACILPQLLGPLFELILHVCSPWLYFSATGTPRPPRGAGYLS